MTGFVVHGHIYIFIYVFLKTFPPTLQSENLCLKPRRALLSNFQSGQRQKWPVTSGPAVSFGFGAELLIALHMAGVKAERSGVNNDGPAAP